MSVLLIVGALYFFLPSHVDVRAVDTEFVIDANDLLADIGKSKETPLKKYIEKAIEVKGVLQKTTKRGDIYTLLLQGDDNRTFVLCEMEHDQNEFILNLKVGDQVKVKGILKGFLKDAIMLNCILIDEVHE